MENIEKLSGGASCETWSFDWTDDSGTTIGLILRRDLGETGSTSEEGGMGARPLILWIVLPKQNYSG